MKTSLIFKRKRTSHLPLLLLIVAIVFVGLSGCSKDGTGDPSLPGDGIGTIPASEIAGYEYNGSMRRAKYWKDGVATYLSDGVKDAQALSISASGSDIFIVGVEKNESGEYYWDNTKMPKFWKNGVSVAMNVFDFGAGVSKNTNGLAMSVYGYNGNAYIVGYMSDGSCNTSVAAFWTNGGTPTLLSNQFNGSSCAKSVFVSNSGTAYATGWKAFTGGNGSQAMIWANGAETPLTDGSFVSDATSIFVSGSDVYVCGGIINTNIAPYWRAVYWKNGAINYLTDGSSFAIANSIVVVGSDVYVAGNYSSTGASSSANATLWKNKVATNLSKNSGSANSLFIKGSDVYVGGYKYLNGYRAAIWKNGSEFLISDASKKDFANGIFIR